MNTALDAFSQTTNIQCCWIQTISDRKNQKLSLAADRGFNDEMRREIGSMNLEHDFSKHIVGIGQKIIVQDLVNDGAYGLSSFKKAGYKWLVAVPLMTYRVYGIFGTASQNKRLLEKNTADLIMVIAGLIANALSKANLSNSFQRRSKLPYLTIMETKKETSPQEIETPVAKTVIASDTPSTSLPLPESPPKKADTTFNSHSHKMESFRKSHR